MNFFHFMDFLKKNFKENYHWTKFAWNASCAFRLGNIYPAKLDDSAIMVNELWQTFYKVIHTTNSLTCVWIDNLYLQETTTKGLLNFLSVYMYLFVDIYYTCTIWYLTKKQIYDIKYLWKNWTSCWFCMYT